MSVMARRTGLLASLRYEVTKLKLAAEQAHACIEELVASRAASGTPSVSEVLSKAQSVFIESYNKQITSVMLLAGAAMAPSLNKDALTNKQAVEKLVVRLIPRPTPRTIHVGDVVALTSPVDTSASHVIVRRVAALERTQMVSDDPDDEPFVIPPNHCWVLADNAALAPPDVIDSRAFGMLDMRSIVGRIVYSVASAETHGAVANSAAAEAADRAVIAAEVDVDALAADMPKA